MRIFTFRILDFRFRNPHSLPAIASAQARRAGAFRIQNADSHLHAPLQFFEKRLVFVAAFFKEPDDLGFSIKYTSVTHRDDRMFLVKGLNDLSVSQQSGYIRSEVGMAEPGDGSNQAIVGDQR